jgi:hypothetical protein
MFEELTARIAGRFARIAGRFARIAGRFARIAGRFARIAGRFARVGASEQRESTTAPDGSVALHSAPSAKIVATNQHWASVPV